MLVLLTRVLLWASLGVLIWYVLARIIPKKYLTWLGGVILLMLLVVSFIEQDSAPIRVIWKIFSFPLSPLGAAIVLLGSALSDGVKSAKGMPAAIALGILLFSSVPLSAQWLVSGAEQSVRTAFIQQAAVCDEVCRESDLENRRGNLGEAAAIVVLGDRTDINRAINVSETPSDVSFNSSLTPRLTYAADLYQQSRARGANPFVFVTAGDSREDSDQPNVIRDILNRNGVLTEDIQIETTGLDVHGTAREIETFLQDRQIISSRDTRKQQGTLNDPRVVIVAPAMVMSRAALTFEKMNLQVVAKPTDFNTPRVVEADSLLDRLPEILPSVEALEMTTKYWDELLNSLYYFLRGWLPNFNFGWDSSIEI